MTDNPELGVLRVDTSPAKDPAKDHLVAGSIDLPPGTKVTIDGNPVHNLRTLVVVVPGDFAHWERFE